METIEETTFDLAAHRAESKRILKDECGIDYDTSKLALPHSLNALGMKLSIQNLGTSCVVFCNGGMGEYDTLLNNGAESKDGEVRITERGTPFFSMSLYKFSKVLYSLAVNRIMLTAYKLRSKKLIRMHKRLAESFVAKWISALPKSEESIYGAMNAGANNGEGYSKAYGKEAFLADVNYWLNGGSEDRFDDACESVIVDSGNVVLI